MKPTDSAPLKRVKTNSKPKADSKDFSFNFEVFFGDIQEDQKPLRNKHCRDFYSLFEEDRLPVKAGPRFSQIDSVLLLTFAVSRDG